MCPPSVQKLYRVPFIEALNFGDDSGRYFGMKSIENFVDKQLGNGEKRNDCNYRS